MEFAFQGPGSIVFGPGVAERLPELAAPFGRRVCLVTGATPARHAARLESLRGAGFAVTTFSVAGEPTVELASQGARLARQAGCELVVSLGGGAVLDAGKAVAALATNPGDVYDHLEVVGKGAPLTARPLPHIALPTTAGTGAEATANAVLTDQAQRVKVSLRSPHMLPSVALVDPLLTLGLPTAATAATGLDALTQLLEAMVSVKANPMTTALCREGLGRAARSLERAFRDGKDQDARQDMALASLFSGLALANAKLGAVHGFAAPLGGLFGAPHGQVCAALLPHVLRANARALAERAPESPALAAFAEAARIATGDPAATPADLAEWAAGLCARLDAPRLGALGVTPGDIPLLVEKAARASSMQGNPVPLTDDELAAILAAALR